MPNRIIRDGFVDSEAINALSDWAHRVYSNLLVRCDDAGRFDGRLEFIRSHLFPLGTSRRTEELDKAVTELVDRGLVVRYEHAGKPFIQVMKWQRCGSATRSRFAWRDGSHAIPYVKRDTRDGLKEFVLTSLPEGVRTPSAPPADGVAGELNTETDTKTGTGGGTGSGGARTEDEILQDFGLVHGGALSGLPPSLNSRKFRLAVVRWFEHLAEKGSLPGAISWRGQIIEMGKWGADRAIAAIEYSIRQGYKGIHEERQGGGSRYGGAPIRLPTGNRTVKAG